ncbi:MAG: hypothetical protein ACAF41_33745 (plasmid) [Leptolyngbya sp. BL-A-14]
MLGQQLVEPSRSSPLHYQRLLLLWVHCNDPDCGWLLLVFRPGFLQEAGAIVCCPESVSAQELVATQEH